MAKASTVVIITCHCRLHFQLNAQNNICQCKYDIMANIHWQSLLGRYHITILPCLLALASLGGATQIGLVLFCVTSPKVAKVSTVVIITCHCHLHFQLNAPNYICQYKYDIMANIHRQSLLGRYPIMILPCLLALAFLGGATQIGLVLLCVASPKVAKASTVVSVTCHCHLHFQLNAQYNICQCK